MTADKAIQLKIDEIEKRLGPGPHDAALFETIDDVVKLKFAKELKTFVLECAKSTLPIGAAIAEIRNERGMRQNELAAVVGITKPYMSQIENGARVPSPSLIQKLARALSVSPAELFGYIKNDKE